jgi:hypothetical protein
MIEDARHTHRGMGMWYFKAPGKVIRLSPSGKYYQGHDDTVWG